MALTIKAFSCLLFCCFSFLSLSQDVLTDLDHNRAPLRFYSSNELREFQALDAANYEKLRYYFTESFEVYRTDCHCNVVDFDLYNQDVFNIAQFEHLRSQTDTVRIDYKEKYAIFLLPLDVVHSVLMTSPESILHLAVARDFPTWLNSGDDDADYAVYKAEVMEWAIDFPDEYRSITNNPDLFTVRIAVFKTLTDDRKNQVLSHASGYLITD